MFCNFRHLQRQNSGDAREVKESVGIPRFHSRRSGMLRGIFAVLMWLSVGLFTLSVAATPKPRPAVPATGGATIAADARTSPRAAAVEILWGGSWWDGSILERRGRLVKVHYTGWGSEWDEWATPDRVRAAGPAGPHANARLNERVEVAWGGSWWAARVIARRGKMTKIHYTGWGSEWDEWVDASRLRKVRLRRTR